MEYVGRTCNEEGEYWRREEEGEREKGTGEEIDKSDKPHPVYPPTFEILQIDLVIYCTWSSTLNLITSNYVLPCFVSRSSVGLLEVLWPE